MRAPSKVFSTNATNTVSLAALALSALATVTFVEAPAHAQNAEIAAARETLIQQAQEARARGDHAAALRAAQQAGEIRMTPSVRLFIAQEQRETGDRVGAVASASQCLREVEADSLLRNRDAIRSQCIEAEARARAEVARVVVFVPDPRPAGLRVRIDDRVQPDRELGLPFDVNPGATHVVAEAAGMQPFDQRVDTLPGTTLRVVVRMTPQVGGAATPGPTPPVTAQGSIAGPLALLISGGVLVLGGVGLFAGYAALNGPVEDACHRGSDADGPTVLCPTQQLINDGRTADTLANLGFASVGVGAALALGGGLWLALRPSAAPSASGSNSNSSGDDGDAREGARLRLRLRPAVGLGAVGLTGVF